jgi:hypothetical protein
VALFFTSLPWKTITILSLGRRPGSQRHQLHAVSPEAAIGLGSKRLGRLAREASPILDRVNHPGGEHLSPRGARNLLQFLPDAPWSLTAWRLILLASSRLPRS